MPHHPGVPLRHVRVLALLALCAGCHARFKHHVADIGEVRPQVLVQGGPEVVLGSSGVDGLGGLAVDVVQGVRGAQAADRIAEAVEIKKVDKAFARGFGSALGAGPPFGASEDPAASLLQVEVLGYGLYAPVMGQPGSFLYQTRVSIYLPDGKKVYKVNHSCTVPFGDAMPVSVATGTVDNVKQLGQMSDAEIQQVFEGAARGCGEELVIRMRKHAS